LVLAYHSLLGFAFSHMALSAGSCWFLLSRGSYSRLFRPPRTLRSFSSLFAWLVVHQLDSHGLLMTLTWPLVGSPDSHGLVSLSRGPCRSLQLPRTGVNSFGSISWTIVGSSNSTDSCIHLLVCSDVAALALLCSPRSCSFHMACCPLDWTPTDSYRFFTWLLSVRTPTGYCHFLTWLLFTRFLDSHGLLMLLLHGHIVRSGLLLLFWFILHMDLLPRTRIIQYARWFTLHMVPCRSYPQLPRTLDSFLRSYNSFRGHL
jgi:hypothetical protein